MINRGKYLNELIEAKNNRFPKVITGIKGCGKSFLLKEIFSKYLKANRVSEKEILLIELDDVRNAYLRNPIELGKHIRNVTAKIL